MSMNDNLAYQEEVWEELIGGKVVAMSPRPTFNHNRIASKIYWAFENYLSGKRCTAIADGTDLYLTERDRFVPDMMVVCDRDKIKGDGVHGAPDLVVEVLSPRTAKRDRGYKMEMYAKCGVGEYWIVEPVSESVEIYLLEDGQFRLRDVYTFRPWEKDTLDEQQRAAAATHFRCSLFDDLDIALEDIFSGLLP